MSFTIVPASSANSHEIAKLVRRSIVELCTADHGGDAAKYEPWLENKTADNVEKWIHGPGRVYSAVDPEHTMIGVAMGTPEGEVLLNYVLPEARFSGVIKTLVRVLEKYFRELGLYEVRLQSTAAAEKLYISLGYRETGETESRRGMTFRSFRKSLD